MKIMYDIQIDTGNQEEALPDFASDFPYIATCAELDKYIGRFVPWHWHRTVELFYIESGILEYYTPKGKIRFPKGSGGMVNSNVLHMTRPRTKEEKNIQLLHIFEPSFIAGQKGSRIEQRYITPIITASQLEIIALYPDNPVQTQLLNAIRESFNLSEKDIGYEIKLRNVLSDIWFQLFEMVLPLLDKKDSYDKVNDKIKLMMIYIHDHYTEKISIAEIAAAAFISERECFRVFHDCLKMTPVEYIKNYRLQIACHMLTQSQESIAVISYACGLGSSSYFGKIFREYIGCTPLEYRRKWQNSDNIRQ